MRGEIMAGVQWSGGKCKKYGAKQKLMHCDKEERARRTHKNDDIDKSKSHLNMQAFDLDYAQTCKKYDDRIDPIVKETITRSKRKTIRKDAVYCVSPIVYVPEGLTQQQQQEFVAHTFDYFKKRFGDNYINGYAHFDEQHYYTDATTKEQRLSQVHIHNFIIPEVDGVLNAKVFTNRKTIEEVVKHFEEYTYETFGIHYVKGTKSKSRKTVEELKQASAKAENERLEKDIKSNQRLFDEAKKEHKEAYSKLIDQENEKVKKIAENDNHIQQQEATKEENDNHIQQQKATIDNNNSIIAKQEQQKLEYEQAKNDVSFFDVIKMNTYYGKKKMRALEDNYNDIARQDIEIRRTSHNLGEQNKVFKSLMEQFEKVAKELGFTKVEDFANNLDNAVRVAPEKIKQVFREVGVSLEQVIKEANELSKSQERIETYRLPNYDER